jgi:acyl dehydratase
MSKFFEDIELEEPIELGSHTFTRDEILSFATRFDPQPFHTDEAAANESIFGGLCASGWHTACIWIRLLVLSRQQAARDIASAGGTPARLGPSPGIRELKWMKPVYPGDVIAYRSTPVEKRASKSRPEWGIVTARHEGINQHGETVLSLLGSVFVERRSPDQDSS